MKKTITFLFSLAAINVSIAETNTTIKLTGTDNGASTIEFIPGALSFKTVSTPAGESKIVSIDKGTPLLIEGAPDLQKLSASLIIPDQAKMEVNVTASTYYDLTGIDIAPSKGNLKRNIDPSNIPFTYGNMYGQNALYPSALASLNTPYILRDHRAQTIHVCPFQYNPITKVLRVYTKIVVTVSVLSSTGGENAFERITNEKIADKEFESIYKRQFINYHAIQNRDMMYTPVEENGSMLVICYDAFAADMQPFITWKNRKGIQTEMVLKSVAGSTASSIKTFIANYYSTHPNLKYVLLVGDAPQIPSSSTSAGDSDNNYGYISGSDSYPELFIGRFSATTNAHVQTMVMRTLNYEETPQAGATWYKKGITIASDQGPGDDNEMDFEHQLYLKSLLMAYTYNNITENYDGSQGGLDANGNPTAASIGAQINSGVGIITYTGHGSDFAFSTSGYSTTNITSLTNTTAHPFIWSVACVNGNFVANTTCFAEGWLRAGTPAAPKGALATMMSTINQSWNPPMEGQDAMVDILVESDATNIKRSFGGLSFNGCMQMNDVYGAAGDEMTDTWTLFGDPSVMVYTNTPTPMVTSHVSAAAIGTTAINVSNNTDGALVCLSKAGVILGTGISNGTSAVITIPAATAGTIDVVATAYNKMPYSGTINVSSSVDIAENNSAANFTMYPNPANNSLNITGIFNTAGKIKLALYNALGQEVMLAANTSIQPGSFNTTIDISDLAAGVYTCKLETGNTVITRQVVIQK
jgi:hypothetical protein